MKFNFQIRDVILVVLIVLLLWQFFQKDNPVEEPKPITIVIPEKNGTTGTQVIERVTSVPVYVPQYNETIKVDNTYKELYENTQDSIEKLNLYLKSIRINEYDKKFVDNDTIEITGKVKTRGDLLEYKMDYKIKESNFTYQPEVVVRRPSLMMKMDVEAGVPTIPTTGFIMKGDLSLINRKGNGLSIGYDTEQRVWLGISKTFTIKK